MLSISDSQSSPLSETNPPSGIRLRVYSVPDLSFQSVQAFGGIPSQNSFTFTPEALAAQKCPSSCKITKIIKLSIHKIIPNIFILEKKLKAEFECSYFP